MNRNNIGSVIWLYTKYQLVTKTVQALVILPIFSLLVGVLLKSSGRTNLTSSDYISFLLSFQGIGFLLLGVLVIVLILGIDINSFIYMSSLVEDGRLNISIWRMFLEGVKSFKRFFTPYGFLIALYFAIVFPLIGMGITIEPLKNLQIPNFMTSVIFSSKLYSALYFTIIGLLIVIGIIHIFTFHYILIVGNTPKRALKNSRELMKKNWKSFIIDWVLKAILVFSLIALACALVIGFMIAFHSLLKLNEEASKIWLFFTLTLIFELLAFAAYLSVPIIITISTKLFYKYNKRADISIASSLCQKVANNTYTKPKMRVKVAVILLLIGILSINALGAYGVVANVDGILETDIDVLLIAHRAGGDLGAENTLEGIVKAIEEKCDYTEIDVQRTADGHYILNHDRTFRRLAGSSMTAHEMTLEQIKKLKVSNAFEPNKPSQPIPTLEEVMEVSKGKIGLFVELKGYPVEFDMVDDLYALFKKKDMLDECVLLSLDYSIIAYAANNFSDLKTGFLYFFNIGELSKMEGDYLIMEEREATSSKVDEIKETGKKAIVWTVNTDSSIDRFIHSNVDGIITDRVLAVKNAIKTSNERSKLEIILDSFIRELVD